MGKTSHPLVQVPGIRYLVENIFRQHHARGCGGNIAAYLAKQLNLGHCLAVGRLAPAIGSGNDEQSSRIIELDIIRHVVGIGMGKQRISGFSDNKRVAIAFNYFRERHFPAESPGITMEGQDFINHAHCFKQARELRTMPEQLPQRIDDRIAIRGGNSDQDDRQNGDRQHKYPITQGGDSKTGQ